MGLLVYEGNTEITSSTSFKKHTTCTTHISHTHTQYRKAYKALLEENEKLKKRVAELEGSHGGHKHF